MTTEKPWGKEELLENTGKYALKRITMYKNCRCSLQYHEYKTETIYVLSGKLKIIINDKDHVYEKNQFVTILPLVKHRMEGIEDSVYLESSTCELNDVIRIEDDYNRK